MGLAHRLAAASTEEALALIEWLDELPDGPLVSDALCALIDRGNDVLTAAVFWGLTLDDCGSPLGDRAVSAIDAANPRVRAAAIGAMCWGRAPIPETVSERLVALTRDPDVGVRIAAVYAVGRDRPGAAVAMLDDSDDETRYAAAYALTGVKQYVEVAEAAAEHLVMDRKVRSEVRLMAADLFRDNERVRAAHELLAREGLFWGARRVEDDVS